MKLYYVKAATPALRWQGTQADAARQARETAGDAKAFEQAEVPTDKPGLLVFLNAMEMNLLDGKGGEHVQQLDELQQAELRAVAAAQGGTAGGLLHYDYRALDARSSLAGMDAGMIARHIEQLHGPDLGKIVAACIKRISDLAAAISGGSNGPE